ncbi:MAG: nucleotidyltransferase family protein [Pseudomonadota bacterium]
MIFAAGFGTRMAPLTDTLPKPLVGVAGQTLLQHALAPARAAGLHPIVVNAHYRAAQIKAALAGEAVTVLEEVPELLDTGGGLKNALPHLGEGPIATMNSDAVWAGPNPFEILRDAWRTGDEALLLCVPLSRAAGRTDEGDFSVTESGRLSRGDGFVYTGAQIILGSAVATRAERRFSFNVLWDEMIAAGTIRAVIYPGHWCDVGRPSSIALAEEMLGVS